MFSRQLVDAVTDVLHSIRGKDGRGRPRLARLHGSKSESSEKKKRERASDGERGKDGRERRGESPPGPLDRGGLNSNDRAHPRACESPRVV